MTTRHMLSDLYINNTVEGTRPDDRGTQQQDASVFKPTWRLYVIIVGLGIANLLAALENTVVAIAAPVILTDLQLGDNFIWITNGFFLSSTATLPLFGQFCNIFGRRVVMLTAIAIFVLGSGICGGASSGAMLIVGRIVQGIGSGGIIMITSIVISDLVPLRQRGIYSSMVLAIFGVGSAIGPLIGGVIISSTTWRWVFYLNLPIGGVAFGVLFAFLRVKHDKDVSLRDRLQRIDLIGNGILSWHTLVPLLIGFAGLILFVFYETLGSFASVEPLMPPQFLRAPTTIILTINTFVYSIMLYWLIFFLPVFFQGVKLYSPIRSGAALLPISLVGIPGSVLGAIILTRWGRYKAIHIVAFALQVLGLGLLTLQAEETTVAHWATFQSIVAFGGGLVFSTVLPAFQAFIHERDLAACTAVWYFVRLFGHIWGVAIPSAVFNNRIDELLSQHAISDPVAANIISQGGAYQAASASFVRQFPPQLQVEIRALYRDAIQRVFQISIAFVGVAFILSFFERETTLRKTIEIKFGMDEQVEGVHYLGHQSGGCDVEAIRSNGKHIAQQAEAGYPGVEWCRLGT
ncbi:major facilitator superfamily domain-containing protein [Astrocystis sublimbata]|nr:major facilitator superfamily domain-containing protein [Astrocystis sublimbata]